MAPRGTPVFALLAVLVAKAAVIDGAAPNKKPTVTVMYESLCPDSIRFVRDQLTPTFEALGAERMTVELIPYGKATTTPTDTGYSFRCQHGPSECKGNKLQACGLVRLLGDNAKQVQYVQCLMSQTFPATFSEKCVDDVGLEAADVKACVAGREGQVLLAGMGEATTADIDFVPTVMFDGKFNQDDQNQAMSNLIHVVCDKLAPKDRPSACDRKKNTSWFFW